MNPSLFSLVPSVVGLVAAVRAVLPNIDGRLRVLVLAIVAAVVCVVLVAAPGMTWLVIAKNAVLLGAMALGGMTGVDRVGTAIGKASSVGAIVGAAIGKVPSSAEKEGA